MPPSNDAGKVFCIGMNKTETTSMAEALVTLGYVVGDQHAAEPLLDDWAVGDNRRLLDYCRSADAFQDVPFSLPGVHPVLDRAYPRSKFVLTVRDSPDQWFDSLARFHTEVVGLGRLPTASDLKSFGYCEVGWLWRYHRGVFGVDEASLFDRPRYTAVYMRHEQSVRDYFRDRPNDLLVLNVAAPGAWQALCRFLGLRPDGGSMPHANRTSGREG